jgi:hypothetical protein
LVLFVLCQVVRASLLLLASPQHHSQLFAGPMDHIFSDAHRHLDNARNFLKPGPMGCSNPYFYQLFLYVFVTLTKENRFGMHLLNAALSVGYPYVWYRVAREVMRKRVSALRFGVVLSVLPTHAVIFQYFMNETVILPLIGASLWASLVAARRRSPWLFLLATVLWTCTMLTRSIALPLAAVVLGYTLFRQGSTRVRALVWRPLLALGGAAIVGAGMYVAGQHSVRIFEYASPFVDNSTNTLYLVSGAKVYETSYTKPRHWTYTYSFSSPSLYISPFFITPTFSLVDWKSVRTGTFKYTTNVETKGQDLKELYWKTLAKNKRLMPRLIFENIVVLAFGHAWPESGTDSVQGRICLHERWIWFPITVWAVLGSLWFIYRRRQIRFVPALAIFATALLYGAQLVVMEGRYRKPIEPIVLLAVYWLAEARRSP